MFGDPPWFGREMFRCRGETFVYDIILVYFYPPYGSAIDIFVARSGSVYVMFYREMLGRALEMKYIEGCRKMRAGYSLK